MIDDTPTVLYDANDPHASAWVATAEPALGATRIPFIPVEGGNASAPPRILAIFPNGRTLRDAEAETALDSLKWQPEPQALAITEVF